MKSFENKVAVITGAASGIGLGLAQHCAGLKMKVVLADIEQGALLLAQDTLNLDKENILSVPTDVSQHTAVKNLVEKTIDRFGRVDLLFNNAGVAAGKAPWESTANDCEWVMGVNLMGVIYGIKEFVPVMIRQNSPCHIVNTSSITAVTTYHPSSLYHLTKHAVVALSEQVYHELKIRETKIGISVLCPGFANTKIMDAERNRPEQLKNELLNTENRPDDPSAGIDPMEQAIRQMIKQGMSASKVAALTFEAIEKEQFYIFTHPETLDLAGLRMKNIMEKTNPELPPMG